MQNSTVALRDRIEELEEENRQLREMMVPKMTFDISLKLSSQQKQILAMLFKASPKMVRAEHIFAMVWGLNSDASESSINVHIHNIRKKLRLFEIEILTIWGEGYFLPSDSAEKLRSYVVQAYV